MKFLKTMNRSARFGVVAWIVVLCGCGLLGNGSHPDGQTARDAHSFARPDEAVVKHLDLDIRVDFQARQITGQARLTVENRSRTRRLTLDTAGLVIHRVTLGEAERPTSFELRREDPLLGRALDIVVDPESSRVTVHYSTSPGASALQWLSPEQTAGRSHPFLFTQSQAILARSWVPCQDTPAVRMTYRARVKVDPELMAVMSARNSTTRSSDGIYEFDMPQPIPSYLLALAVGDLEFRAISDRSGVYAEPSVVEKAAWEFADTEKMIVSAEKLYGPYRWTRYDVLVLPPSFPWGGMENPRLTFATPTILAGDRSLVSLIAHELAHSWSGNLVTNANWNDFWLNEGFTVYFEHRIMEEVYGKAHDEMLASLGYDELLREMEELLKSRPRDTHLHLDLTGRDPNDGMTSIAYEKGYFFLRTCETIIGRERWDGFLRSYFDTFAFRSMTAAGFITYLREQLIQGDPELEEKLQIDRWVYGAGLPENVSRPRPDAFSKMEAQLEKWQRGEPSARLEARDWSTQEWLHFLRKLPSPSPAERLAALDGQFQLTDTGNYEVLCEWLLLAIASGYDRALTRLEPFLISVGRLKFIRPLYKKLSSTSTGRREARRIYGRARPRYHPISVQKLDELLDWNP